MGWVYIFDVVHHNSFDLQNLIFDSCKLAELFRMVNAVLHLVLQLGPIKEDTVGCWFLIAKVCSSEMFRNGRERTQNLGQGCWPEPLWLSLLRIS